MSAETLRRAAALMRERAEAADALVPSQWATDVRSLLEISDDTFVHAASWHPAVALAVADWLDGVAILLEGREDEEWFDLDGDPISPEDTHAIGSALAVARAYLEADATEWTS